MGNPVQVFQTSNPIRWKSIKWTGRVILLVFIFLLAVLILAIRNGCNPNLPNINAKARYYQAKLDPSNKFTFSSPLNKKFNPSLVRAAFYTPWLPASLSDLQKNVDKLNTIYPQMVLY